MSRTSLAFSPVIDRDFVGRKVSIASSTSSGGSSGSPQRRPFAPIDVQVSKGDTDSSLRVMESDLYSVYAVNSFTFGSPAAGPSQPHSSSLSPPSPPAGDHTLLISSPRSHASHQFSVQSATLTRSLIAQTRHPPSPRRSLHSRVDSDSTMTSSSSVLFSVGMPMTSNPTTPSHFTSEGDADWTSDSSEDGEEYEISIGSTRYEEDGSVSSIRARDSLTPGFSWAANDEDNRFVPPISEEQDASSSRDTESIPESNISPTSDYIQPPPRAQSLRPTLNIETSPDSPESDRPKLDEEEPVTARPVPAFHYPTRISVSSSVVPTIPQEQDFDPDWSKLSGGIVTFDIDEDERSHSPRIPHPIVPIPYLPSEADLPSPPTPGRRRSFFTLWRKDSSTIPTTTPNVQPADTFETHAKQWEPNHMGNNRNWAFKRVEEQKGMLRHRPPERDGGNRAEVWTVPGIEGVFLLKRIFTDGTSYQLVVQYAPPRSSRNQGGGKKSPILLVHRHSKVLAFSLGWVRKDSPPPASAPGPSASSPEPGPSRVDPDISNQHRKHHTMHLLATRAVQQSYTSTATVRRLEDWGLLNSSAPSSPPIPNSAATEQVDAPKATVSTPLSLPSQPLDRPIPVIPSPKSQYPPSPTFTDESYAEDDLDIDGIFRRKRKPTSHFEAFATMSASEQLLFRQAAVSDPPVFPDDRSKGSPEEEKAMNKVLWPNAKPTPPPQKKRLKLSNSAPAYLEFHFDSNSSQSTVSSLSKPTAERFTPFRPPWVTLPTRALTHAPPLTKAEEEQKRTTENMARSFNRTGLTPDHPHNNKRSGKVRQTVSASDQVRATVFDGIPKDALFMLLPLWMGEIEGKTREDIRFLLIWYKVDLSSYPGVDNSNMQPSTSSGLSRLRSRYSIKGKPDEKERDRSQTISAETIKSSKSSKSTVSSSNTTKVGSASSRKRANESDPAAEHKPFFVLARLVSYSQLQDSGVRVPDTGLQDLAFSTSTDTAGGNVRAGGDQLLTDYILARCPGATPDSEDSVGAVEFDETCMIRLGLAFDSQPGRNSTETSSSEKGCTVRLTHIGRSILEMAWAGALVLIEFGAV